MFLLFLKPTSPMNGNKYPPILICELGNLQVFHYPSPDQITRGLMPTEVYWQDKASKHTYGPFTSIHAAFSHYTWTVTTQKVDSKGMIGNVIYADFVKKKRITVG